VDALWSVFAQSPNRPARSTRLARDAPCYHPLFVFNQFGDLERCALRPGNVHSADGWESVLKPVLARYRGKLSRIYFRADAGFASANGYEYLEGQRIKYAIRLPANRILQERAD
jgi:Transposase DDE domain group 1